MMEDFVVRLAILFFLSKSTSANCPSGFTYTFGCSCYQIVTSPTKDRYDATLACAGMSSHLVFIESHEEQQFLSEICDSSHEYWLGLNDGSDSTKTWDDGSVMVYSRIGSHSTATDNNSGCYRIITDAQAMNWDDGPDTWYDKACHFQYGYICEYKMVTPECEATNTATGESLSTYGDCPSDFAYTFGCSCYQIVTTPTKDRYDATLACAVMSSHLVFIESYEEQQFLSVICDSSHEYWLGLNDASDSTKTWDDGSVVVYSRIGSHSTATDNNSGCYRIITDAQAMNWEDEPDTWYDKACHFQYGYICEYEMDSSYCQGTTTSAGEAVTTRKETVSTNGDTTTTTEEIVTTNEDTTTTTQETTAKNGDTTTTTQKTVSTKGDTTTTTQETVTTKGDTTTTTQETVSTNGCPAGFEYQNACSCYHIVTSPLRTRLKAQQECEKLSSHLVFIESEQEKQYLSQSYDPSLQYWLGLNGKPYETKTWDDGSIVVYSNLAGHQFAVDDRTGCYRIISESLSRKWCVERNTWFDLRCNKALPYICEYELDEMNCTSNLQTTATPVPDTDVGEFFGLDHVDVYLQKTYHLDMFANEWSVTSCASKCTELDCGAILFQYETNECKIATLTDVTAVCNPVSVFRTFSCIHGPGYNLCY